MNVFVDWRIILSMIDEIMLTWIETNKYWWSTDIFAFFVAIALEGFQEVKSNGTVKEFEVTIQNVWWTDVNVETSWWHVKLLYRCRGLGGVREGRGCNFIADNNLKVSRMFIVCTVSVSVSMVLSILICRPRPMPKLPWEALPTPIVNDQLVLPGFLVLGITFTWSPLSSFTNRRTPLHKLCWAVCPEFRRWTLSYTSTIIVLNSFHIEESIFFKSNYKGMKNHFQHVWRSTSWS